MQRKSNIYVLKKRDANYWEKVDDSGARNLLPALTRSIGRESNVHFVYLKGTRTHALALSNVSRISLLLSFWVRLMPMLHAFVLHMAIPSFCRVLLFPGPPVFNVSQQ